MIPKAMVLRWPKEKDYCESDGIKMELKVLATERIEKHESFIIRPRIKVWMTRAITIVVLWTSLVQLIALGELLGPSLLKGMPHCFSTPAVEKDLAPAKVLLPPKSEF